MYAMAHALVAPTSSNTEPKSHVDTLSTMAEMTRLVLKMRCKFMLNGSPGK